MSVKVVQGDLFKSSAQTLVNTVNCVGAMGKGIADEGFLRYRNTPHGGCREHGNWREIPIQQYCCEAHWNATHRKAGMA